MKRQAARRLAGGALVGALAGILAGEAEMVWLVWRDAASLPPVLYLDAAVIYGGLGLLVGILAGAVWAAAARLRARPDGRSSTGYSHLSRRAFLKAAAGAAVAVGALGAAAATWRLARRPAAAPPGLPAVPAPGRGGVARGPNLLLITVDTLRADQLGAYGHPYMVTPALDALAAQGARFEWFMAQQPQTNPSHGSLFTGMHPASSGMRVHMVDRLPDGLDTLAKLFASAGFATAGLFSWMSFDQQYCNFEPGFQLYQDLTSAAGSLLNAPGLRDVVAQYRAAQEYLRAPQVLNKVTGLKEQQESEAKGHADVTTAAAVAQLSAMRRQRFFMWLHYYDPHYPFQPPAPYADLYDPGYAGPVDGSMPTIQAIEEGRLAPRGADLRRLLTLYQGEISYLDSQIAALFQALDTLDLSPNTVVALTGDHGESFGEHTYLTEGGAYLHPHSLYNTEQRVPLLMRYPGHIRPGTVIAAPAQVIDLFPTLLELAGRPVPDQAQGSSLVPLLDGSDGGRPRAAYSAMANYVFTSITVPGWKLIQNNATGQQSVFDLVHDPAEAQDAGDRERELARELSGRLQGWMREVHIS